MSQVIIVGAGAVGVCCAYYLQRKGFSVTVLERRAIGAACSAGNAGLIVPSHVIPLAAPGVVSQGLKWLFRRDSPFYIRPRLDPALWSWVWRFTRNCNAKTVAGNIPILHELLQQSAQLFDALYEEQNQNYFYRKNGLLMVYRLDKYRQALQSEADTASALGIEVNHLDEAALRRLEPQAPVNAAGAFYYRNDAHLDPARFVTFLADSLKENGVVFHENTDVQRLEKQDGHVRGVHTSQGYFEADMVVIAGGSWSPGLTEKRALHLPVEAGKGYSLTLDQPRFKPEIPMILSEEKATITPLADQIRFAGTLELSGLDASVNRKRFASVVAVAPQYLPDFKLDDLDPQKIWSGFRPCTPDGLPIIGRSRKYHNLLAATGHAMLGITLAPVTGLLISKLASESANENSAALAACSPLRFSH